MRYYVYNGVKYFSEAWNDLEPFDVITKNEYRDRYMANYEYISSKMGETYESELVRHILDSLIPPSKPNRNLDIIKTDKIMYLPLPFGFFNDYMTSWTSEVCMKNITTCETKDVCTCQYCDEDFLKTRTNHPKLLDVKDSIKQGVCWNIHGTQPWSYESFTSIKYNGLAKPINNTGKTFPQGGAHRILFLTMSKSDIPCFFNATQNIINGIGPYFGDGKYCTLVIKPDLKKTDFYLNFYYSSFDKNRDKKVGEVVYE